MDTDVIVSVLSGIIGFLLGARGAAYEQRTWLRAQRAELYARFAELNHYLTKCVGDVDVINVRRGHLHQRELAQARRMIEEVVPVFDIYASQQMREAAATLREAFARWDRLDDPMQTPDVEWIPEAVQAGDEVMDAARVVMQRIRDELRVEGFLARARSSITRVWRHRHRRRDFDEL